MAITSTSTLADVMTASADKYTPTADDITAWKALTGKTSDVVGIKMGLFGESLTEFLADCALATTNCKVADYEKYNGWALGV